MTLSTLSSPAPALPSARLPQPGRTERMARTADLLRQAADARDETSRQALLDEVVVLNIAVADSVANRYRSRGLALEDLRQVAYLALVKAAQGFDPDNGNDFLSYAVPTIRGEVKRHFRDQGWAVRPPRRIQELQSRIATADAELSFMLGRSPKPSEIADHLDEAREDVIEALASDGCFRPASLDKPLGDDSASVLGDLLGEEDQDQAAAEARVVLAPVVRRLGERDRRIVHLRFFRGWTQAEIASDIGVTQMQVSRLLTRIFAELRESIEGVTPT